jgi:hypothetical protein
MPKFELHGQKDLSLAIGALGDVSIVVAVASTHAQIRNIDKYQAFLYSIVVAPAFPGDWMRGEPGEELNIKMGAGARVNLRKPFYPRNPYTEHDDPVTGKPDVLDVPIEIEVSQVDWS